MGSRILQSGTIISRTANLLQSGVLKQRPLWLDVVEAFPPFVPTQHNRTAEKGRPVPVKYEEDSLRTEFNMTYQVNRKEIFHLEGLQQGQSVREIFVKECQAKYQGGVGRREAAEQTFSELRGCGVDIMARADASTYSMNRIEDPLLKAVQNVKNLLKHL